MLAGGPCNPATGAHNEELFQLNLAIDKLPEEARTVIRLRHEDQLGWDEIGRRLGKSGEAVASLVPFDRTLGVN